MLNAPEEGFQIEGVEVGMICILGKVTDVDIKATKTTYKVLNYAVVVYHVTIVAIWMVQEIFAHGNRLSSTHFREFPYLKLCRPACFILMTESGLGM